METFQYDNRLACSECAERLGNMILVPKRSLSPPVQHESSDDILQVRSSCKGPDATIQLSLHRAANPTTEDDDKSIETTDFDTTFLVPWLPRSNPLSNRGVGGVVLRYFPWYTVVRPLRT